MNEWGGGLGVDWERGLSLRASDPLQFSPHPSPRRQLAEGEGGHADVSG